MAGLDVICGARLGHGPSGNSWRIAKPVVAVYDTFGDEDASIQAARADVARTAKANWMTCVGDLDLGKCIAAVSGGLPLDVDTVEDACDALGLACGSVPVAISDREDDTGRHRTVTIASASGAFHLLDVTASFTLGKVSLGSRPIGIAWTRHALARHYQRTGGRILASRAIAIGLIEFRALIDLATEVAIERGKTRFNVPCGEGMMAGSLSEPAGIALAIAGMEFTEAGASHHGPYPEGVLDLGVGWTGITYFGPDYMGGRRTVYADRWSALAGLPEVRALEASRSLFAGDDPLLAQATTDALDVVRAPLSALFDEYAFDKAYAQD